MAYGLPATLAVATWPALTSVTLPTVSPLTKALASKALSTGVCPYTLLTSCAVIVKGTGEMVPGAIRTLTL
jgi:hypothetical protein